MLLKIYKAWIFEPARDENEELSNGHKSFFTLTVPFAVEHDITNLGSVHVIRQVINVSVQRSNEWEQIVKMFILMHFGCTDLIVIRFIL